MPAISLACSTVTQPPQSRPVSKRLEIDPSEKPDILGWWWDDTTVILLSENGSYRIWAGHDRYRPPVELGRWDRENFNTVWLDPYDAPPETRTHLLIRRIEGKLRLEFDTSRPLLMTGPTPPPVVGDGLLGTWIGDEGKLEIAADGGYRYQPIFEKASPVKPVVIAGHFGSWRVVKDRLLLTRKSDGSKIWMEIGFAATDPSSRAAATPKPADPVGAADSPAPVASQPPDKATPKPEAAPLIPISLSGTEGSFFRPISEPSTLDAPAAAPISTSAPTATP